MTAQTLDITLTTTTCGAACWFAREDACHCSCGGRNHGILLIAGAEQPQREAKINGIRYRLLSVGSYSEAHKLVRHAQLEWPIDAPKLIQKSKYTSRTWEVKDNRSNEPGARWWIKKATEQQIDKWGELSQAKAWTGRASSPARPCYLVWERIATTEEINATAIAAVA